MESPLLHDQLEREIIEAFPRTSEALTDTFIEANSDIFTLEAPNLQLVVPAYLLWCVRHTVDGRGSLVPDYVVHALAEFGRSKNSEVEHLNFKHTCSAQQRAVVAKFLRWCLNADLVLSTDQIERALKYWVPGPQGGANAV